MKQRKWSVFALILIFLLSAVACSGQSNAPASSNAAEIDAEIVLAVPREFFIMEPYITPTWDEIITMCNENNVIIAKNDLSTFEFPRSPKFVEESKASGSVLPESSFEEFWKDSYILTAELKELEAWKNSIESELESAIALIQEKDATREILARDDWSAITFYTNTLTLGEAYDLSNLYMIYQLALQRQYLAQKDDISNILNVKNTNSMYLRMLYHKRVGSSSNASAINPNPVTNNVGDFLIIDSPRSVTTPKWVFDLFPKQFREVTHEEYAYELSFVGVAAVLNDDHTYTLTMSQDTYEAWKEEFRSTIIDLLDQYCLTYEKFNLSYSISEDFTEITLLFDNNGDISGLGSLVEPNEIVHNAISYRVLEGEKREATVFIQEKSYGVFRTVGNSLE